MPKEWAAIKSVRAVAPQVPLVVLTGMDDELLAMRSLREGVQDYLIKGQVETRGLLRALRYASERKRLEKLKDEFVSTVSHELLTPSPRLLDHWGFSWAALAVLCLNLQRNFFVSHHEQRMQDQADAETSLENLLEEVRDRLPLVPTEDDEVGGLR